jgi:DNA-directed RNA polymerase subunit beta
MDWLDPSLLAQRLRGWLARLGEFFSPVARTEEREEIGRISEARDEELKEILHLQTIALLLKKGTVEPFLKEGTKLTKEVVEELNFKKVDLTTLKVQNKTASEKARRVIDEAQRRIDRVREKTEEQIDKVFQPDELPPGVVQLVKVYIAEKRKIAVGDKMAGRHGNKGIIARIAPEEDMPFLPDGTPVEIVLNPLGVPSRMNVGQILETHMGWAARVLGFEAKTPVFQGASENEVGALLKIAGISWARAALTNNSKSPPALDAGEIVEFLKVIQEVGGAEKGVAARSKGEGAGGIHYSEGIGLPLDTYCTPALDKLKKGKAVVQKIKDFVVETGTTVAKARGEKLADAFPAIASLSRKKVLKEGLDEAILELMAHADILAGGKVWLRDGRNGRNFDFPVTVGAIYMLKLSHLVDDKIHARSIGPYSLVTQQPLAGKAQFGGQRFGEMEVWALEAYGAAHTLQEILTVKSDDVTGRSKVYEAIVKGENLPEPGIPESFNVLVKELQALGLSVTLGQDE